MPTYYVSEMVDQLRDLLNDGSDTDVIIAQKKRYLNNGIRAMYPRLYRIVSDTSTIVSSTTVYSYPFPASVASGALLGVEIEVPAEGEYYPFYRYEVSPGDIIDPPRLRLTPRPHPAAINSNIKMTCAMPFEPITSNTYASMQSEDWTGSPDYLHLPVLYAMGMLSARGLDDRLDYSRYSTTQAQNGATEQDIVTVVNTWFERFDAEVEAKSKVLPLLRPRLAYGVGG
jgi:hypothetical protein